MTEAQAIRTNLPRNHFIILFLLLLFALSIPCWVFGSLYDIQLFPGFMLFQLPLGMPMVAGLIMTYREKGKVGLCDLL